MSSLWIKTKDGIKRMSLYLSKIGYEADRDENAAKNLREEEKWILEYLIKGNKKNRRTSGDSLRMLETIVSSNKKPPPTSMLCISGGSTSLGNL